MFRRALPPYGDLAAGARPADEPPVVYRISKKERVMHVRTTRIVGDPTKAAADGTASYQAMVAAMKEVDGFIGALLLIDRPSGGSLGLTFWENEEKLRASEEVASRFRREGAQTIGATIKPVVERFEVAFYGMPERVR